MTDDFDQDAPAKFRRRKSLVGSGPEARSTSPVKLTHYKQLAGIARRNVLSHNREGKFVEERLATAKRELAAAEEAAIPGDKESERLRRAAERRVAMWMKTMRDEHRADIVHTNAFIKTVREMAAAGPLLPGEERTAERAPRVEAEADPATRRLMELNDGGASPQADEEPVPEPESAAASETARRRHVPMTRKRTKAAYKPIRLPTDPLPWWFCVGCGRMVDKIAPQCAWCGGRDYVQDGTKAPPAPPIEERIDAPKGDAVDGAGESPEGGGTEKPAPFDPVVPPPEFPPDFVAVAEADIREARRPIVPSMLGVPTATKCGRCGSEVEPTDVACSVCLSTDFRTEGAS